MLQAEIAERVQETSKGVRKDPEISTNLLGEWPGQDGARIRTWLGERQGRAYGSSKARTRESGPLQARKKNPGLGAFSLTQHGKMHSATAAKPSADRRGAGERRTTGEGAECSLRQRRRPFVVPSTPVGPPQLDGVDGPDKGPGPQVAHAGVEDGADGRGVDPRPAAGQGDGAYSRG